MPVSSRATSSGSNSLKCAVRGALRSKATHPTAASAITKTKMANRLFRDVADLLFTVYFECLFLGVILGG